MHPHYHPAPIATGGEAVEGRVQVGAGGIVLGVGVGCAAVAAAISIGMKNVEYYETGVLLDRQNEMHRAAQKPNHETTKSS